MAWPDPADFCGQDACLLCGICLNECEFLRLPHAKARQEIMRLVEGEETEYVLKKCRSCGSCNAYCPQDMDIWTLIVSRQFERHRERGIPVRRLFALPLLPNNIWTSTYRYLPEDERSSMEPWSDLPSRDEVMYAGCATRLFPYLLDSRLMDGVDVMGALGFCEGGMYYQAGLLNVVEFLAERIARTLEGLDIKRFVMACPSCDFMFKRIMPEYLDIEFEFELRSITEWLWENIESGRTEIVRKVDKKVVVQEACHAKAGDQLSKVLKILDAIGAEVVEVEDGGEGGKCCGMGDISIRFNPLMMFSSGMRQWRRSSRTKADMLLTYCPGCLLILSGVKRFYPTGMDIYHIMELVQLAAGEEPAHRHAEMAARGLRGMVKKGLPRMLSTTRLTPEEVLAQVRSNIGREEGRASVGTEGQP